eukprot:5500446-Prymnesium_polylepis.1
MWRIRVRRCPPASLWRSVAPGGTVRYTGADSPACTANHLPQRCGTDSPACTAKSAIRWSDHE